MANASIPGLPVATSLDGTEQMEIVQPAGTGGTTKRATTGQIAALAGTGASPPAATFLLVTANSGLPNSRTLAVDTADIVYTDTGAGGTATIGPINTAAISYAKFQQVGPLSVIGQSANATGVINAIAGTADQVMRVDPNGSTLGFGQVNLSSTAAVTGFLATSYITGTFASSVFTGIVAVPFGGTGTETLTANGVLVGNGTGSVKIATANTAGYVLTDNGTASPPSFQPAGGLSQYAGLSVLGVSTTATATPAAIVGTTDQVLRIGSNGTTLAFGQVNLSTSAAVTGTLAVGLGGSGATTLTAFGVIYGNGTSAVGVTAAGSAGQLLLGQTTTSAPSFKTSTGDVVYSAVGTATIATNAVTFAKFQTMTGLSVLGVTGTAVANATAIIGTAGQALVVNSGGTGLAFGQVNLSATTSGVTGTLAIANGGSGQTTAPLALNAFITGATQTTTVNATADFFGMAGAAAATGFKFATGDLPTLTPVAFRSTVIPAGTTTYGGVAINVATRGTEVWVAPAAGTIKNFYARANFAPGGTSTVALTLGLNGTATSISCTMTGAATTATDLTHSFTCAASDYIDLQYTSSANTTSGNLQIMSGFQFIGKVN